jgi:hypothetical protein
MVAVIREKEGIDKLGFATGIFTDKRNGQLVFNQQLQAIPDAGADVIRKQVVVLKPQPITPDLPDQFLFPAVIGLNLL